VSGVLVAVGVWDGGLEGVSGVVVWDVLVMESNGLW